MCCTWQVSAQTEEGLHRRVVAVRRWRFDVVNTIHIVKQILLAKL